jgi:hypothetical protein
MPALPKASSGLNQPIDLFVNEYFKKNKISWQKSVDDKTYIRRVYLDVTGLLPSPESINDFVKDYHAFRGNAYGLANTLMQTAVLKPTLRNRKLKNMFYAGQLTVPGPGVPPALISGRIAAEELIKSFK